MENQYVTQPAMPVSFDPARYLRQPGRTQVATLVAASFFGCLLALLLVYGIIILATKVMAAKLIKEAATDTGIDTIDELPPAPAPRPQPQRTVTRPATPPEARLLFDVLASEDQDDDEETQAEPTQEQPEQISFYVPDVPDLAPVSPVPTPVATPTPTPTAAKRPRR